MVSQSTNIFENLAFEQLLHLNLPKHVRLLLLYHNKPCIVSGKFQNPWLEIYGPRKAAELGIPFVRRCSGGGTVFHDTGNANISYLQPRLLLNKRENLIFITDFLKAAYDKKVTINERSDLIYEGKKISGSANRIEKERSLHHFTLLLNSDLSLIRQFLGKSNDYTIESTATRSVPSPVNNLFGNDEECPDFYSFARCLGNFYCTKQGYDTVQPESVLRLNPTDFSEVVEHSNYLKSWDWLYGLTPKFKLSFALEDWDDSVSTFELTKGRIKGFQCSSANEDFLASALKVLEGKQFLREIVCRELDTVSLRDVTVGQKALLNSIIENVRNLPIY